MSNFTIGVLLLLIWLGWLIYCIYSGKGDA